MEQSNPKPRRRSFLGLLKKSNAEDVNVGKRVHKKESTHMTGERSTKESGTNSRSSLFNFSFNRKVKSEGKRKAKPILENKSFKHEGYQAQSALGMENAMDLEVPSSVGQGTDKGKGNAVDHDPSTSPKDYWKGGEKSGGPGLSSPRKPGKDDPRQEKAIVHAQSSCSKDPPPPPDDDSDPLGNSQTSSSIPPTIEDIDRWTYHTDLQRFGESLQAAATSVFPNQDKSRYTKVSVLMLQWLDEDPNLPVSIEISNLARIFQQMYDFAVIHWKIPDENCHFKLAERVMRFVEPRTNSEDHLKIVYYAGHAKLMDTRALALTSWRNKNNFKSPMVKWGAIQSFIEESPSDALILLDCCVSGTANTSEGNGVTELISACAWNQTANGVGPYSLTSALTIELGRLGAKPSFSVGELYRNVSLRTQSWMPESITRDGKNVERHPAPIHLVLTQDATRPRSIQLSPVFFDIPRGRPRPRLAPDPTERFPRLAFAVRLQESFKHTDDMERRLLEWLRDIPIIAEEVTIEAGFDSFSTLLILSIPLSLSAYIPFDPAVVSLSPINSENRIFFPSLAIPKPGNRSTQNYPSISESPPPVLVPQIRNESPPKSLLTNEERELYGFARGAYEKALERYRK